MNIIPIITQGFKVRFKALSTNPLERGACAHCTALKSTVNSRQLGIPWSVLMEQIKWSEGVSTATAAGPGPRGLL